MRIRNVSRSQFSISNNRNSDISYNNNSKENTMGKKQKVLKKNLKKIRKFAKQIDQSADEFFKYFEMVLDLNPNKKDEVKSSYPKFEDVEKYIKNAPDAMATRIDGIPSKEAVSVDNDNKLTTNFEIFHSNIPKSVDLVSGIHGKKEYTIVVPMTKKKSLKLGEDGIFQYLNHTSTFRYLYKNIRRAWFDLTENDDTKFTNVLWIPGIHMIANSRGSVIKDKDIVVNVLVTAFPNIDNASDGVEKVSKEDYMLRIVNDTYSAAIKLGCKTILVDPFHMRVLRNEAAMSSDMWNTATTEKKYIENIQDTFFSIEEDDLFIIFSRYYDKYHRTTSNF